MSGSKREASINKKLAFVASKIAQEKGVKTTYIDLNDFEMPLYDGDVESENGLPESAIKLKQHFIDHDGFFIVSPEYNSSFSPLLKNVIDWLSRPHQKDEPPLSAYKGKIAAIGSASPGMLGGIRGLVPLRMLLGNIGVHVIPSQVAIGGQDIFSEAGDLVQDHHKKMLHNVISELIATSTALHA